MTRTAKSRNSHRLSTKSHADGFSLVELVVVIAITVILLGVVAPVFMKSSLKARQVAREVVQGSITRARSHAIATGIPTAILIPQYQSSAQGGKAIGIAEMVWQEASASNPTAGYQVAQVLQRSDVLPGNMMFLSSSITNAPQSSIMDETLTVNAVLAGANTAAAYVVFSSSGQIVHPAGKPIEILLGPARLTNGKVESLERSNGQPSFDRLQINRLTGKARQRPPQQP